MDYRNIIRRTEPMVDTEIIDGSFRAIVKDSVTVYLNLDTGKIEEIALEEDVDVAKLRRYLIIAKTKYAKYVLTGEVDDQFS